MMDEPLAVEQEDPLERLKRRKAAAPASTDDPLERLKARKAASGMTDLLNETGIIKPPHNPNAIHDEYKVGNLARRMANENAQEAAELEPPGFLNAASRAMMATEANVARNVIPGMPLIQTAARSLVRRQPMAEAREDITGEVERIPGPTKALGRAMGALPFAASLGGMNPLRAGALLGGAEEATSEDPIKSYSDLGFRALRTGAGAAVGGAAGKLLDVGTTGVRSAFTPNPQNNILARQAARAKSANEMYGAAMAEGKANEATPAIRAYLAEPEVAARVEALKQLDEFANVAPESPEMLDALYKSLSDEAKAIGKGQAALDPSKPNRGRFLGRNVESLKKRLTNAMSAKGEPLTFDVPAEVFETQPRFTPGREAMSGPIQGARPARTLPGHETVTGPIPEGTAGRARGNASQVAIDPSGKATAVSPRDVQGPAGPSFVLRGQPEQVVDPGSSGRPAFQLRGQPDKVQPGVRIETPAMRVQTAPAGPAMMPSYRDAAEDFARRTKEINAVGTGMTALQGTTKPQRPTFKQIMSKEPKTQETYAEWANRASPGERQASSEGILGDIKNSIHEPGKTLSPFRRAASKGSDLLRATRTPEQELIDLLQRFGLGSVNASLNQP